MENKTDANLKGKIMVVENRDANSSTQSGNDLEINEPALLRLIADLKNFERTHKLKNRFNFFTAVGMDSQEIKHSRFLAFLLNPRESHGIGDAFLRYILDVATFRHPNPPLKRIKIAVARIDDCSVYCERNHFDITIEIPSIKLIFVIENKVNSHESENQLKSYEYSAKSNYGECDFMGTFLTPEGREGETDDEHEKWGTLGYDDVKMGLADIINSKDLSKDVQLSIEHYINLIESRIVQSNELINACKEVYKTHKKAIDLVVELGSSSDFVEAARKFIKENSLKELTLKPKFVSFTFESWLLIGENYGVDRGKWESDFPVKMWFGVSESKLSFFLEVGPIQNSEKRRKIIDSFRRKYGKIAGKSNSETWTRIIGRHEKIKEEVPSFDDLVEAMQKVWKESKASDWEQDVKDVVSEV